MQKCNLVINKDKTPNLNKTLTTNTKSTTKITQNWHPNLPRNR